MAGSTKGGFAAGAVLGAALGALVAWALTGGAPRGGAPAVPARAATGPRPVAKAPAPHPAPAAEPGIAVKTPDHPGRHADLRACQAALAAAEARAGKANAQLHQASDKLAVAKAIQAQNEGTPITPPPGMPARFKDPKFARARVQALFDGVGGGEVTSVDCTEFPCLVYGDVSRDDDAALAKAFQALRSASFQAEGWGPCGSGVSKRVEHGKPTDHVVYGVCPKGYRTRLSADEGRRLGWRIGQMFQADHGR